MSAKLQPEIEPAARWLSRKLAMTFDEDLRLWLGGGSPLAARYHHRLSTDLDLWWSLAPGTPLGGIERYAEQVTGSPLLEAEEYGWHMWSEDEAEEAKRALFEALERNDPEGLGRAVWRR